MFIRPFLLPLLIASSLTIYAQSQGEMQSAIPVLETSLDEPPPSVKLKIGLENFPALQNCVFKLSLTAKMDFINNLIWRGEVNTIRAALRDAPVYIAGGKATKRAIITEKNYSNMIINNMAQDDYIGQLVSPDSYDFEISFDAKGNLTVMGVSDIVEFVFPHPPPGINYRAEDGDLYKLTHLGIVTFEGALSALVDGKIVFEKQFECLYPQTQYTQPLAENAPYFSMWLTGKSKPQVEFYKGKIGNSRVSMGANYWGNPDAIIRQNLFFEGLPPGYRGTGYPGGLEPTLKKYRMGDDTPKESRHPDSRPVGGTPNWRLGF